MTVADITQLVTTVGFPIVACAALFWYINTTQKEMLDALDNNTNVIAQVLEHLRQEDKKNDTDKG